MISLSTWSNFLMLNATSFLCVSSYALFSISIFFIFSYSIIYHIFCSYSVRGVRLPFIYTHYKPSVIATRVSISTESHKKIVDYYINLVSLLIKSIMATIKVHGSPFSTATMRVTATLYEKQLEFEFVPIDMRNGEHKKEPFLSLNVSKQANYHNKTSFCSLQLCSEMKFN